MAAEVGHHANRVYVDQNGDFHLNGGSFFNDAEDDISASLEVLNDLSPSELAFLDGVTAGTVTASKALVVDASKDLAGLNDLTFDDGANIIVDTTTGTQIGTAVGQKIGFWGVTPVVQPAAAGQADQGDMTTVGANTGTAGAGLSLIGDTTSVDQSANLMNDLLALQEDIAALDALVTEIRTALVNTGVMKGSA